MSIAGKNCQCGCGTYIAPSPKGWQAKYVKGHHLKGKRLDLTARLKRMQSRYGEKVFLSPFLDSTFVHFNDKCSRWYACIIQDGRKKQLTHAKAVYEHTYGSVPDGYHVHHKDGNHETLNDDRPENLMLLPDEWNLRFFPVLAKGFGIAESVVTDLYVEIFDPEMSTESLFSSLCEALVRKTRKDKN